MRVVVGLNSPGVFACSLVDLFSRPGALKMVIVLTLAWTSLFLLIFLILNPTFFLQLKFSFAFFYRTHVHIHHCYAIVFFYFNGDHFLSFNRSCNRNFLILNLTLSSLILARPYLPIIIKIKVSDLIFLFTEKGAPFDFHSH